MYQHPGDTELSSDGNNRASSNCVIFPSHLPSDVSEVGGRAQGFIKNGGQRSLTYDATNISKVAGGDTVEELEVRLLSFIESIWATL